MYIRYIAYMKRKFPRKVLHIVLSVVISVGSVLLDRHVAPDLAKAVIQSLNIVNDEI